jgi:hypothetical protein
MHLLRVAALATTMIATASLEPREILANAETQAATAGIRGRVVGR